MASYIKDLFDWWSDLNEVPFDWRSRFDSLRDRLSKCENIEDAREALELEGFADRYPLLPKEGKKDGD